MWKNNIETLEQLPKRESRKEYITLKYGDFWNLRRFDSFYISDKNDNSWHIISTILNGSIGKNVDKVYSKICKLIRPQDKDTFKWFLGKRGQYYVDNNKCIQRNKEPKRTKAITFYSDDFQIGYIPNKCTKEYSWWYIDKRPLSGREPVVYLHPQDFKKVVVSGYSKTFSSKKDPEYLKLMSEQEKKVKKEKRNQKNKVYSFKHEE